MDQKPLTGLLINAQAEAQIKALIDEVPTKFGVQLINAFRGARRGEYYAAEDFAEAPPAPPAAPSIPLHPEGTPPDAQG